MIVVPEDEIGYASECHDMFCTGIIGCNWQAGSSRHVVE
jgi:hypothetical protein